VDGDAEAFAKSFAPTSSPSRNRPSSAIDRSRTHLVLIPSYNTAHLAGAFRGARPPDTRMLVIDGSTDGSADPLLGFGDSAFGIDCRTTAERRGVLAG